jgi:hypothetical protein
VESDPATNIYIVFRTPKTAKQIKEIVFCAGRAPDFFHLRFRKELLFHITTLIVTEAFQVVLNLGSGSTFSFQCSDICFF